ncbi:MAG: LysM peptidoglycan-binding domain-containing protein [Lachnospiraceae bacterium]|nr:LysM peptidoglycan-binding domain-containing protein [Lachnospiraceae bacterium]
MDKQMNILSNTRIQEENQASVSEIQGSSADKIPVRASAILPVNTRTIGTPEGIYILYLEDYVHTFLKKVLAEKRKKSASMEEILDSTQPDIALYGRSIEEHGRYRIVVSGAALLQENSNKVQQYNDTYFPSCSYIGSAYVSINKDSTLRLELTLQNTKVILDDFYIYYDQNEEMQNYLVEWNKTPLSPTEHEVYVRKNVDDAARLGRIAQAYNREEAKVSFMWNVMNVLCLGFVVGVMAYGIISINNYSKMQNMQANIDYCMAFIAENTSFELPGADSEASNTVAAIQQNVQAENEKAVIATTDIEKADDRETERENIPASAEMSENVETGQNQTAPEDRDGTNVDTLPLETEASQPDAAQASADTTPKPEDGQAPIPQYYVVRRGDTLRTICYDIYGDYSRVEEICRWNNIDDPDNILYGQKLLLP